MPIAVVMTIASGQLTPTRCAATVAIAGTKTSRMKTTNSPNCGARIGTEATQKVKTTSTSAICCGVSP